MKNVKVKNITQPTDQDREIVRMLVRIRDDFQGMRKRIDNRTGMKADGTRQNVDDRELRVDDLATLSSVRDAVHQQEDAVEKSLKKVLRRFPIYREWLKGVKGVGTISAGWIIAEYDIRKATTVSKMWQFTGLNPGMRRGKKRIDNKDGTFSIVTTDTMIRGDKLTEGFIAPFNKRLRTAMVGVLADSFLKSDIRYRDASDGEYESAINAYKRINNKGKKQIILSMRGYGKMYVEYKARLEQEDSEVDEISKKGAKAKPVAWKDAKPAHRDRAARRHMVKEFLKDLYAAWRKIEGLPARKPYAEEYLGKKHGGFVGKPIPINNPKKKSEPGEVRI